VEKIKAAGLQIYPWTVNAPEDIQKMVSLGVEAIITDYPERIKGI
jgi:glycerophosphoryl diester phosphodiesterase